MGKFGETRDGVGKSGVLEHKSGNRPIGLSLKRVKIEEKVTMDRGPIGTRQRSFELPRPPIVSFPQH